MANRDRLIIIGPIIVVAVTTVVFYGGHRLRVPLEPSIVLAAMFGLRAVLGWLRPGGAERARPTAST